MNAFFSVFDTTKNEYKKYLYKIIPLGIALIVALLCWGESFSWFADNHRVNANGLTISVKSSPTATVSTQFNGTDIGSATLVIELTNERETIFPGSSGNFSAYISWQDNETTPQNQLQFYCQIQQNHEGVVTDITDEGAPSPFVDFFKSHLLFFLTYENGIYDDWIDTTDGVRLLQSDTNPLTIYWVWVEHYEDFTTQNGCIADTDARAYILANGLKESEGVTEASKKYDNADWDIGIGLNGQSICFTVDMSVVAITQ